MIRAFSISILMSLLLCSCSTYTTFYGETTRSIDVESKTRRLDVSYQNLKELPVDFKKLKALRMLNLSGNKQLDIASILGSLPSPGALEVLVLDSLYLDKIPKELSAFKNLKQLSLACNPLLPIEKAITAIEEMPLEFLSLKGNQLTQLPGAITRLETLKDLNLSYNELEGEQSYTYLSELPNLYSLWLDHNKLETLPKTINKLSQVNYLYLDHNKLSSLPDLSGLKSTRVVHINHNQFEELPEQLMGMPKLLLAHVNNNKISVVPREFGEQKYSMMALILDGNPLPEEEQLWAKKTFKKFFLMSFEQTE